MIVEGFQITGPPPRPDMAHRVALDRGVRELRARRAATDTRAASVACPDCGSTGYDSAFGYCDRCGYQPPRNSHVLDQRSTGVSHTPPRCGMCGGPWPDCCIYGLKAQGRCC